MEISLQGLAEACSEKPDLQKLFKKACEMSVMFENLLNMRKLLKVQEKNIEGVDKRLDQMKLAVDGYISDLYAALAADGEIQRFPKFQIIAFAAYPEPEKPPDNNNDS